MARFDFDSLKPREFWGDGIARAVIAAKPKLDTYTCAAGISPSGVVHFGNFRDVITAHTVGSALRRTGKEVRVIFSWDNFDRLRKVPAGVPENFAEHIGKPLSKVPDPLGELPSYAVRFQVPFVAAMQELGIEFEYLDQTSLYESGTYDSQIFLALQKRKEIADILLSFMTEKGIEAQGLDREHYREHHYPIAVYSRFTGKDNTRVLSYDGATSITYECLDTGKQDSVDLAKEHIAKLGWKVDWAMRWKHEGVVFEPGGHDHASPGGSYDTASVIAKDMFGYEAPTFAEYKFIGIQGLGAKMSGSKGNAISPSDLLGIYDPIVLKWLYVRRLPAQSFMLAFDSEIYRQYDEFDRQAAEFLSGKCDPLVQQVMEDSVGTLAQDSLQSPIPLRQAVGFGQVVQWDAGKLKELLHASGLSYSGASIAARLPRARTWLDTYNPEEKFSLLDSVNTAYAQALTPEARAQIAALAKGLAEKRDQSVDALEEFVYDIPKQTGGEGAELKKRQRAFFADVYNLLIGKDTGPRLGTFLWAIDRDTVLTLLTI
jgi:lysyl-tRNA synthetase class 1